MTKRAVGVRRRDRSAKLKEGLRNSLKTTQTKDKISIYIQGNITKRSLKVTESRTERDV